MREIIRSPQGPRHKYNFYQLVRLLEMLRPTATSVGAGADPSHEPVRFRSSFSLAFPPSEVASLQPATPLPSSAPDEAGQLEMMVSFLGLGGAQGPLPHPLTEWVLDRNATKDYALRDFLDIFNHRLVSLLYRVRRQNRLGMQWSSPEHHQFSSYLMALLGLLTEGLQDRLAIPDRALLRYVGILTKHPRDATGLQTLLCDFFAIPVRVLQLRGAMRKLDADQWTHLGQTGRNRTLGVDALLGTSIWDQQAGIEVELGPVPWASYLDFLPGQEGLRALCQLVRFLHRSELRRARHAALASGSDSDRPAGNSGGARRPCRRRRAGRRAGHQIRFDTRANDVFVVRDAASGSPARTAGSHCALQR